MDIPHRPLAVEFDARRLQLPLGRRGLARLAGDGRLAATAAAGAPVLHDVTLPGARRAAGRAGRPVRRRQDDDHHLVARLYDATARQRAGRRHRRARRDPAVAARRRRRRDPGRAPVPRHDPGQPALRPPRRDRGADGAGAAGRPDLGPGRPACPTASTPSSATAATGSPAASSSGSPSPGCCSRPRPRRARRGDRPPRQRVRGRGPAGPRHGAAGPHVAGHRPPALHGPRRRPDPRRRRRPDRRARHPRSSCSPQAASTPTSTAPSSPSKAASPRETWSTAPSSRSRSGRPNRPATVLMAAAARLEREAVTGGRGSSRPCRLTRRRAHVRARHHECCRLTTRSPPPASCRCTSRRSTGSGRSTTGPRSSRGWRSSAPRSTAIGSDPEAPTFANTLEALERSGRLLDRVLSVFYNLVSSDSTDSLLALEGEVSPMLAAHQDAIHLDAALFARIDQLHRDRADARAAARAAAAARAPAHRLRPRRRRPRRAGAGAAAGAQRAALDADLDLLHPAAGRDPRPGRARRRTGPSSTGSPRTRVAAAEQAARTRGLDGYLLTLVLPTAQPALASLTNRALRRRLHEAAVSRGLRGNEHDTREVITQIAALRAERAALLGFADHASYVVADQTAGTVEAVASMLGALVGPGGGATPGTRRPSWRRRCTPTGTRGRWSRGTGRSTPSGSRPRRYDVDDSAAAALLRADRVLHDGVFRAATALYGITFDQRHDLPVYHPDVRVFEVNDDDGTPARALRLRLVRARHQARRGLDEHLRRTSPACWAPGRSSWSTSTCREPPAGEPALMTLDEVRTAFHEFGHALHGLFSDVTYPRLSGTNVPARLRRVPVPGQRDVGVVAGGPRALRRHHVTGEPLPQDVGRRAAAPRAATARASPRCEYLGAALLDQEWHRLAPGARRRGGRRTSRSSSTRPCAGTASTSTLVPPRYRSTYFAHVFAGGYDAGYYSYIWSEVLDADLVEWFHEHGGLQPQQRRAVPPAAAQPSAAAADAMEMFAAVRGRGPRIEPLLRAPGPDPRLHLRGRGWRHRRRRRRCRTGMTPRGR